MGHNKINGATPSLDARISATLNSADVDKAALIALLDEAHEALVMVQNVITAETPRLHDLSNTDPDKSLDLINRSKLRVERLEIAIPKLHARIQAIEAFEYREAWQSEADAVNVRSMQSAERLKHYAKFVVWLQAEFNEIDDINAAIHALHARAPSGADRLLEPELIARGLDSYTRINPPLRELLRLPKWDRSSEVAYPPDALNEWNARAAQANQALAQRLAMKGALVSGDNWHASRDLAVAQEEHEFAKKGEEIRAQHAADKVEYERRLQENDRRRLGGIK